MSTDDLLAAQYEDLPYPARNPKDELKHLQVGSPGHLRELDQLRPRPVRLRRLPLTTLAAAILRRIDGIRTLNAVDRLLLAV